MKMHGGIAGSAGAGPALRAVALAAGLAVTAAAASAVPLAPGDSAFKTDASVPDTPKYTIGLPAYFTGGNIVGSLTSPIAGDMLGTVMSTVYVNPANECLTFAYYFQATDRTQEAIARATIGGLWEGVAVTDAGADASGSSGEGDPMPEWTDGDPLFLARDPITEAPSIQWRAFGIGSALGPGDDSSIIWFATDSKVFQEDNVGLLDTAAIATGRILAPGSIIPLPTASLLGMAGMGAVASRRRRSLA